MNNRNRNKRNNQTRKKSKVIRCKTKNQPVFEHEVCTFFSLKDKSITQDNCKNCKNSF
jgi:hypothetical protein